MAHEFIDLKGFLFLVLITIPQTLSTNINCGGKPFHCLNTTHFMICVDLGGGVSSTIDDFIIPCPPTTVCETNNRFECEFPKVEAATTDLNIIAVSNVNDKRVDAKTIPPDKWTTALPLPEKKSVTELPPKEKPMSSLNSDILEHLKDEFTGGNEKVFDDDIVPLSTLVDFKNSTVAISFVTPKIDNNITTTEKYPHPKINEDTSTNRALSDSQTITTLKENITCIEEPKAIENNNTGNKFNTTKEMKQLYGNEINQTLDKHFGVAELTTPMPNISIEKIFNIDLDSDNSSSIHATQNIGPQKKIFQTVPLSRNDSDMATDSLSTFETVVATTSKYNGPDLVDHVIATKSKNNNSLPSKVITTDTNHNVESTTQKLKKDNEYSHTLQQGTGKPIEITTMNLYSPNTSGKDLSKLKATATSTNGSTIINKLNNTTNPLNTTKVTDQKLDFNVSANQELLEKIYDSVPILANVSEMTIDKLGTTEPGLVTSSKYNGQDNVDNVITSGTVVKDVLSVKVNSTVSNYTATSVSEILKKDDKHKDLLKKSIDNIHETLEIPITPNLSTESVTQPVIKSVSQNESNNTMQDSSGFIFEMTTSSTMVSNDNIIGFKSDIEMKSKENASIFNDAKIKKVINKTKEVYVPTETLSINEIMNHNMKPTMNLTNSQISKIAFAFRETSMNNSQTSAIKSPVKSTEEQLISNGDNYINNLNTFVTSTIEKPKTIASSLGNNLTTFGNNSMGIESTGTVDFIQQHLNYVVAKYNVSIDMEVQSSSTLSTIPSINIDGTNAVLQNTTPVLQPEAVTYSNDKGSYQDTIIEKEISKVTTEINVALKTIENNNTIYKNSGIGGTYLRDIDANQLLVPGNSHNVNVELSDKLMNLTEQKKLVSTENASMTANEMSFKIIFVSGLSNNFGGAEELKKNNTIMKSITFSSNMSNNENNEVNIKNRLIPTLATTRANMNHFENFSSNLNEATSEQVSNLSNLHSVNVTLLTEQKGDVAMKPLESATANIGLHKQNITSITETTTELDSTIRHPLITESVTEGIYSTILSTGTSSSNDVVGSTRTVMEYPTDEITLNDTESKAISSSRDIYPGLLINTANSFTETNIHKINESSQAPTALITDLSQDTLLSPNNETKISNKITTGYVKDVIELETGYDRNKFLTSNTTTEKLPIITVNHILPNKTVEMIQNNANFLDNIGMQIVRSDLPQSTQETIAVELDTLSTLPTPVAVTVKPQPNFAVNRFLSSTVASIVKVEKQIMNWNIANTTEQVTINDLDNISTPTPIEATGEEQKNILVNPILPSTVGSIIQPNMYELAKAETPIESLKSSDSISLLPTSKISTVKKEPNITVNRILFSTMTSNSQSTTENLAKLETLNITQSTLQKVATDVDDISMLSTPNELISKKDSNITANRISSSTVPLISKSNTEESAKSPQQVVVKDFNSMQISPSLKESTAKTILNITVKQISPSTKAVITQNVLGNLETPIGNLNISQSTPQSVANDLDSKPVLLMTNESNIAENQIVPSVIRLISQLNTQESDGFQIQVESSSITQTTQETVDTNLHNTRTSILPMSLESTAKQQPNPTVNPIAINTTINQNDPDKVVELGKQIVKSNITRNTLKIMGNDLNKTSFNIVTEPATIVETINDIPNTVGRSILSDIIFGEIIFTNGTANLKSPNQLNNDFPKEITERATLNNKLQKTTLFRNTSEDLNRREDLYFDDVNGTSIDKQLNIELSGSVHDNETSAENYEISTVYDKFASQKDVTSPSTPVNYKSKDNVGYKSPRNDMDMAKNFAKSTQNITLLNKIKYIYDSTNNSESMFGNNKEQKSITNGTDTKMKNSTAYIFFKQQIKQLNTSAESHMSKTNFSYSLTNQMTNNSSLKTVVRLLTNVKVPPRTINPNKVENTTLPVDCLKLPRGKYADSKDCQKFYICVGKLQPIVGTCPNNTVFSEINKQCTKNLSHCVRNNQFHCLYEGRFSDFLRDNIYYICVKNKINGFLRYRLQCQNGYHLNKEKVKCEENEIWNQSDTSISNSNNVSIDRNISFSNSDVSESSGDIELECKKEGKYPYPKDCRKYYVCTKNSKDEYRRKIKSCSSEEIYDKKKKKCVSSDSEEG